MAMSIERIHELFDEHKVMSLRWIGECHDCKKPVVIDIKSGENGFEVIGGSIYEIDLNIFKLKCDACFKENPTLEEYQSCEVYSRVVGYMRPVKSWNEAKQCEFKNREMFKVSDLQT